MIELATLLGTSVGGKIFGIIQEGRKAAQEKQERDEERAFRRELAAGGNLKEYMESFTDDNGDTNTMGLTLCGLFLMFGFTACSAVMYLIWAEFQYSGTEAAMLDPTPPKREWSILGGALKWSWETKSISYISPLGYAYLILHPILFVLNTISTGNFSKKRSL